MRFKDLTWFQEVSIGVAGSVILFGLYAWYGHLAQGGEHDIRIEQNEKAIAPIIKLVESLGNRAEAEDAGRDRDAQRCRQGVIKNEAICHAAGEAVIE